MAFNLPLQVDAAPISKLEQKLKQKVDLEVVTFMYQTDFKRFERPLGDYLTGYVQHILDGRFEISPSHESELPETE